MGLKIRTSEVGLPPVLFRGSSGSTSELLARADLLELLDQDVYEEMQRRSDLTDEDIVVLVNRYLRRALEVQPNQIGAVDLGDE